MSDPHRRPCQNVLVTILALLLGFTALVACRPAPAPEPQDEPEEPELPRPQTSG